MSKQDRQGVRTAAEFERKYNIKKNFTQAVGIAEEAKRVAEEAQSKEMSAEEIFNILTNNGQVQGIYQQDGKWYINAELAVIINLIAEHLKSIKGNQVMEIDGGKLEFYIAGLLYASIRTNPLFGYGELGMYSYKDGKTSVSTEFNGSGFLAESNEEVHGITNVVQAGIDPETGIPYADFPRLNDKRIWWEDNGDGTFTLKGE